MATIRIGDYSVNIKAVDVSAGRREATGSFINDLVMFLMYASKYMDQIDMRTCAREPELWSEDLFKYLTESGFYERIDTRWEELQDAETD